MRKRSKERYQRILRVAQEKKKLEEWRAARLKARKSDLERETIELLETLSQGTSPFASTFAHRLREIATQEVLVVKDQATQFQKLREQTTTFKLSLRMFETFAQEEEREKARKDLEEMVALSLFSKAPKSFSKP